MMKPADLRHGDDAATWRGIDDSGLGTVVVERLVWARGVVVGEVGTQEPAEMRLVQNEEVVEALAANGADDPLDKRVLPGRARGDADLVDPHPFDSPHELLAVDRVSITKQESRSRIVRERLDDLLSGPDCRRVIGDVEMEELAAIVPEDDEDEEEPERER
jgi:hypothetical protein